MTDTRLPGHPTRRLLACSVAATLKRGRGQLLGIIRVVNRGLTHVHFYLYADTR